MSILNRLINQVLILRGVGDETLGIVFIFYVVNHDSLIDGVILQI